MQSDQTCASHLFDPDSNSSQSGFLELMTVRMTLFCLHILQIFRETKESEIQNLLRAKRELENKLSKVAHGYLPEDTDTTSRSGLESMYYFFYLYT